MKNIAVVLLVLFLATPVLADVGNEYRVRDAEDLVALCDRDPSSVDYIAARNFCLGYALGAYQYYYVSALADPDMKIVCVKEPYPERKKVIEDFVVWSKAHPSFMKETAIDALFRFLVEAFPCK
jgi:hypothetical protein